MRFDDVHTDKAAVLKIAAELLDDGATCFERDRMNKAFATLASSTARRRRGYEATILNYAYKFEACHLSATLTHADD